MIGLEKTTNKHDGRKEKKRELIASIKNKIQIRIIIELFINQELSLTQISKHIKKSKSTIVRNLRNLTDSGIIYVSKEVKVRGSIKSKYYRLRDDYILLGDNYDDNSLLTIQPPKKVEEFIKYFRVIQSIIKIMKNPLDILNDFIENYEENENVEYETFYKNIKKIKPLMNLIFISEEKFKKVLDVINDFHEKIKEITSSEENQKEYLKKPFIFMSSLLKMNELYQLKPV
ncbi:MAG: transcriptional regulator [Promethearchaeota archaeon]|nr:MAG: transcriptional regulator [Candidatus Lokiarchaeota archaeon]